MPRSAGWPAAAGLASALSDTVHEQCFKTERYFFLTTISRNSILVYFSVLPNRPNKHQIVLGFEVWVYLCIGFVREGFDRVSYLKLEV